MNFFTEETFKDCESNNFKDMVTVLLLFNKDNGRLMIIERTFTNEESNLALQQLDGSKEIPSLYRYFACFSYQQYLQQFLLSQVYNSFLYILFDDMGIEKKFHENDLPSYLTVCHLMMQWCATMIVR